MRDIDFDKLTGKDLIDYDGIAASFKSYLMEILWYTEDEADFVISSDFEDPYDTPYIMQDYEGDFTVGGKNYEVRFCYTDFRACGMFHLMENPPFEFYMFIETDTLTDNTVGSYSKAKKIYLV